MNEESIYLSAEGLTKLEKELHELKTTKRKEVARRIFEAKELGDLSENAEYAEAKNEQAFIEGRILEIENTIKNAQIFKGGKQKKNDVVSVGATFTVTMDGASKTYTLVGSNEADPMVGKISNVSPLGKAFIGRKVGETVDVTVPKGTSTATITGIS